MTLWYIGIEVSTAMGNYDGERLPHISRRGTLALRINQEHIMSIFRSDLYADKVVLITGGGSGICKGIAEGFAAHGASLVISSRKQDRLDGAATEIRNAHGGEVLPWAADVREPESIDALMKATLDRFGRIDVVINGAAGNFLCPASQLSPKGFKTVMEIDAGGTFNVSKAAFDAYLRDHGGNIINISANLQYTGTPMQVHAASAKAAVDAMTRIMAVEWGPLGIRVNVIAPGPIDGTEGMTRLAPGDVKEKMKARIPLGRYGRIQEIADTALFVASPAASYMSGALVVVDGAQWLAGGIFDLVMQG